MHSNNNTSDTGRCGISNPGGYSVAICHVSIMSWMYLCYDLGAALCFLCLISGPMMLVPYVMYLQNYKKLIAK